MLAYMIPGYTLYKKRIITDEGTKDIGKLLVYVILPCTIVNSCNMEYSREKAAGLLLSFLAAAPIGSNVAVYAQIHGGDHKRAVWEIVLSTILCVAAMPFVIGISEHILRNIP